MILQQMQKVDELAIQRGLKIKDYPNKWESAKNLALLVGKHTYKEESAFEAACRMFLELGGESDKGFYDVLEGNFLEG